MTSRPSFDARLTAGWPARPVVVENIQPSIEVQESWANLNDFHRSALFSIYNSKYLDLRI